jgi:hypothetical protein
MVSSSPGADPVIFHRAQMAGPSPAMTIRSSSLRRKPLLLPCQAGAAQFACTSLQPERVDMQGLSFKLLTILAASALVTPLHAAGPNFPKQEKYFNSLDGDKDGKLSIAEIGPRAEKRLFRLDQNADGSVSRDEIETWLQKGLERRRDSMLADYDANQDGAITREELANFLAAELGKADKNADGGLSLDESRAYRFVRAGDAEKPAEEEDEN